MEQALPPHELPFSHSAGLRFSKIRLFGGWDAQSKPRPRQAPDRDYDSKQTPLGAASFAPFAKGAGFQPLSISMLSASVSAGHSSSGLQLCGSAGLFDPAERVRFPCTSAVGARQSLAPAVRPGKKARGAPSFAQPHLRQVFVFSCAPARAMFLESQKPFSSLFHPPRDVFFTEPGNPKTSRIRISTD